MKLTKATLKQLIQEELQAVLAETLSAEKQAKLAKAAALGVDTSGFENTFLGEKAKDYKSQQESAFNKMIADTQVGTGDLLMQGLQSGITSMAMGKV